MLRVVLVSDRALFDARLNDSAFRILALLSQLSGNDGTCCITQEEIGNLLGKGVAAIARALDQLASLGHIIINKLRGRGARTRYIIPDLCHAKTHVRTMHLVQQRPTWDNRGSPQVWAATIKNSTEMNVPTPTVTARTGAPDRFVLSTTHYLFAQERGIAPEQLLTETELFLDHHRARGSLMADWQAAWRTWIRRVKVYEQQHTPQRVGQSRPPFRSFNQQREDECYAALRSFAGQ